MSKVWSGVLMLGMLLFLGACQKDEAPRGQAERVDRSGKTDGGGSSSLPARKGLGSVAVSILPEEPTVESDLRAMAGTGDGAVRYAWRKDGVDIAGENGALLPRFSYAKGERVSVSVQYAGGQRGDASVLIRNAPPGVLSVGLVTTTIHAGVDIEALPQAEDPDGDEVEFSYLWLINGEEVFDSGPVLPGSSFSKGDEVVLRVVPSDGEDEGPFFEGEPLVIPNAPPKFVSEPPMTFRSSTYHYNVQVEDADGDALSYEIEQGPPGMEIDTSGSVAWEIGAEDAGEHAIVVVVRDDEGLSARQEFTLNIAISE